jgi:hypothetical protein
MGLIQEVIATFSYGTLMGILERVQNDTWELFHDLQNVHPLAQEMTLELIESLVT